MTERIMAYADPELGLIASEAMQEEWKQRIGKKPISRDRVVTAADRANPDIQIAGSTIDKDMFSDDDVREITVAEIDERMLDLADADQSSPATTKAYNDLRDLKDAMIGLSRESGLSYSGTAELRAAELESEGKSDEAEVMRAAGELLGETNSRPFQGTEHTPEENAQIVRANIDAHNARVARNLARQ